MEAETGGDGGEDGGDDSAEDRGRAAEDGGRKSVEDEPNIPIHAEFYIEYGSTFAATATDVIPSTSATHNCSCESFDTLYCRLNVCCGWSQCFI